MSAHIVNDIHSQLNPTAVADVVAVDSLEGVQAALARARADGHAVCMAGGRHAMGGQQFCTGGLLLETRPLRRVLGFDADRGRIEVEAGIQWPELLAFLHRSQEADAEPWAFAQKQTGADRMSLGGSVAANAHGRGLDMRPIVDDVESLVLVTADGTTHRCSRSENAELFALAVGGYGLFGVICSVVLRLVPRRTLERVVEVLSLAELAPAFDRRIRDGYLYGDFQFSIDERSEDFLTRGIFSCYRPVAAGTPVPAGQRALSTEKWRRLLYLAHTDKARAYEEYVEHYLATSGQLYHSDAHQLAEYTDDYHLLLDRAMRATVAATEVITELYVPRSRVADFMAEAAADFRRHEIDVVYGTLRLIRREEDTFLRWARDDYACVIFNLHTVHAADPLALAAEAFRRLIDMAVARGGSFYLTYHRHATRAQVEACYPEFESFLAEKRRHDESGLFDSDWHRHHRALFDGDVA